jgi:hypothetical protein
VNNQSPSSSAVFCQLEPRASGCGSVGRAGHNGIGAMGNAVIGPQLPSAGTATSKLVQNGCDAMGSVIIGPQLPKRIMNGCEPKRDKSSADGEMTRNSTTASKLVSTGNCYPRTTVKSSCVTVPLLTGPSTSVSGNQSSETTSSSHDSGNLTIMHISQEFW